MGNVHLQTNVSRNWKETRKHEKTLSFKEVFYLRDYTGTSKAAHEIFQKRDGSSIREFSLLYNLHFFARNDG